MSTVAAWLALAGAVLALVGSLGLVRMRSFYERVHPPTLGGTLGTYLVLAASGLFFAVHESRWAVSEVLIAIFMAVTTPVTYMLLVRAALHRDRAQDKESR